MANILTTIITSGCTLVGVILTVIFTNRKTQADFSAKVNVSLAVFETKLTELTREVREHNNYGTKIAALEARLASLESLLKK